MPLLVPLLMMILLAGCDRAPQSPPAPPSVPAVPARERVEAEVIAMLPPGRATHLARAGDGTLWWVQENDGGQEPVFALGAGGVPRATALTPARVLAAAKVDPETAGAGGAFHSLAADRHGRIWFYFAGGAGPRSVTSVGWFDPRDDSIRTVLDHGQLEKATGMGASLVLARGTLVPAGGGDALWLWVRHSDNAAVFRIDAQLGKVLDPINVVNAAGDADVPMYGPGLAAGAAAGGALLLRDAHDVELWRIEPTGRATWLHALIGLPTALSAPAGGAPGRVYLFAGDAPLIPARTDEEARQPVLPVSYPALLIVEEGKLRGIDRRDFALPEGLTPEEMRVGELIAEPPNALIGYDEHSGALLRFRIVTWP